MAKGWRQFRFVGQGDKWQSTGVMHDQPQHGRAVQIVIGVDLDGASHRMHMDPESPWPPKLGTLAWAPFSTVPDKQGHPSGVATSDG